MVNIYIKLLILFYFDKILAVSLAIARDGSSGGVVRYAVITDKGVERNVILNNEIPRFFEDNIVQ
jgi:hypothetical protein